MADALGPRYIIDGQVDGNFEDLPHREMVPDVRDLPLCNKHAPLEIAGSIALDIPDEPCCGLDTLSLCAVSRGQGPDAHTGSQRISILTIQRQERPLRGVPSLLDSGQDSAREPITPLTPLRIHLHGGRDLLVEVMECVGGSFRFMRKALNGQDEILD